MRTFWSGNTLAAFSSFGQQDQRILWVSYLIIFVSVLVWAQFIIFHLLLDVPENVNFSIYLDGKTLVGKLAPTIDEQMGTLHVARARGV